MKQGPPQSYFERETELLSDDGMIRVASGGRVGLYGKRYVNLETRRFINERRYNEILRAVVREAANNPALSFEAQCPDLVACVNSDPC
jgi:hypothetical protein